MKPGDFCAEAGFDATIFFTWSFDVSFFERIVLRRLQRSGTSDVLILVDGAQAEQAARHWRTLATRLGTEYALEPVFGSGAFHPKVIVRVGAESGAAWIGSGNLTPAGWGHNREVASCWRLGPGLADDGGWLARLVESAREAVVGRHARATLDRIAKRAWLRSADPTKEPAVLSTLGDEGLAGQLARRWPGRRFDRLLILTGSTDIDGAMLRWAAENMGIQDAAVCVEPWRCTLSPTSLASLPAAVRTVTSADARSLHAKFYWFDGPEGPAAIMGSANCSAAAWFNGWRSGGNAESVVVFDHPERNEFEPLLDHIMASASYVSTSPDAIDMQDDLAAASRPAFRLSDVVLDLTSGRIEIALEPDPPANATVSLLAWESELAMTRIAGGDGGSWECPLPLELQAARTTFVEALVRLPDRQERTPPRWVHDHVSLQETRRLRRVLEGLRGLGNARTMSEQQRAVDDISCAIAALLSGDDTALDGTRPARATGAKTSPASNAPPRSLDPSRLAASLTDTQAASAPSLSPLAEQVSLAGLMRMLFDVGVDADEDALTEDEGDGEAPGDGPSGAETGRPRRPAAPPSQPTTAPPRRQRERLIREVDRFVDAMRAEPFAGNCGASRLVEAAAFPLTVAVLGLRSSWVEIPEARRWAERTCESLFTLRWPGVKERGLLARVRERHAAAERSAEFQTTVGDGTLWLALNGVLALVADSGASVTIENLLAIDETFSAHDLLSSSEPGRLRSLLGRLRLPDSAALLSRTAAIHDALQAFERWLRDAREALLAQQASGRGRHEPGDLLWHPTVGWSRALETSPVVPGRKLRIQPRSTATSTLILAGGHHVNVRLATGVEHAGATLLSTLASAARCETTSLVAPSGESRSR